jgi:hypothetical protein
MRYRANELRSLGLSERGPRYPALGEALFRLLFFAGIAVAAAVFWENNIVLQALASAVIIRLVIQVILFARAQKRLGEKGLLPILWLWDVCYPFYYFLLIFTANFKHKQTWR